MKPETSNHEEGKLADLISNNLSESNVEEQLHAVTMILSRCLGVSLASVSVSEGGAKVIQTSFGFNAKLKQVTKLFCNHTTIQNEVIVINDTLEDDLFKDNPLVIDENSVRFYAGFPLTSLLGNNIGTLCIADTSPRKLDDTELSIFKAIGKLINERVRMNKLASLQSQIKESQKCLEKLNNQLSKSNQFYKQLFGQYMSESLLEKAISNKKDTELGGEERYLTVLISDLRGFSPLLEEQDPKSVVDILNTYLEEMIDIIHKHEGYINEILGDGILVIFGAPNHVGNSALKAVQCAREMQKGIKKVNKGLQSKGLPVLEMGIGINSGNLIVGNIGSKRRMKYGVVGENINIASRIESLTMGGQILVSEALYEKVTHEVKSVGSLRTKIKGFNRPLTIHDVSEAS